MTSSARLYVAEPASRYDRRPRLVVDASLLASIVFGEQAASHAVALLRGRALCAPSLVDLELANVAVNKVRRRLAGAPDASTALALLERLDLERFEVAPRDAFDLAPWFRLSACVGAYLLPAARLEIPLATFDARLGEASRRHRAGDCA